MVRCRNTARERADPQCDIAERALPRAIVGVRKALAPETRVDTARLQALQKAIVKGRRVMCKDAALPQVSAGVSKLQPPPPADLRGDEKQPPRLRRAPASRKRPKRPAACCFSAGCFGRAAATWRQCGEATLPSGASFDSWSDWQISVH